MKLLQVERYAFDLTDQRQQDRLYRLTEDILALQPDEFTALLSTSLDVPLELQVALKLAESRSAMAALQQPVKVGIVFAMWGEHHRLRPRSPENPNGENALQIKLDQLDWEIGRAHV